MDSTVLLLKTTAAKGTNSITSDQQVTERVSLSSLEKGLALMEVFRPDEDDVTLAELAARTALPRSTAHRLLSVLVKRGFVETNGNGTYRLGMKVWEVGAISLRPGGLLRFAQPYLERLAEMSEETVHLSVRDRMSALYVARIASLQRVAARTYLGQRVPLYCTATGKALLAYSPEQVVTDALQPPLTKYTEMTIIDPEQIREELMRIRQFGFANNVGQQNIEIAGVAAPVLNPSGQAIAAFGVAGPAFRFSAERLEEMGRIVKSIAAEASGRTSSVLLQSVDVFDISTK